LFDHVEPEDLECSPVLVDRDLICGEMLEIDVWEILLLAEMTDQEFDLGVRP
jgi:hypothetical protein